MNVRDAIDFAESNFACALGHASRQVDMGISNDFRRYVTWEARYNLVTCIWGDDDTVQNHLASVFIAELGKIQRKMAAVGIKRPTLFWRYHDKLRFSRDTEMASLMSRLYIVNCNDYGLYLRAPRPVTYVEAVKSIMPIASATMPLLAMMSPVTEEQT